MNLSYKSPTNVVADNAAITMLIEELLGRTIDRDKVTIKQEKKDLK